MKNLHVEDGPDTWPAFYRNANRRAMQADAAFFRANPEVKAYTRAMIPGEFGPTLPLPERPQIHVMYMAEGMRVRIPIVNKPERGLSLAFDTAGAA